MPLADRMKLADGKPLPRRLMAAMAQQDCGQCGYNCKDYADALFAKSEKRLNLCVPGGKETARMLKQLYQELGGRPAPAAAKLRRGASAAARPRRPLARQSASTPPSSRAAASTSRARKRKPGTSRSISPAPISTMWSAILRHFPGQRSRAGRRGARCARRAAGFPIGGRTLREVLTDGVSLSPAPDMLFQLISYLTGGERRQKAKALAAGEDPDGDAATLDVLAALHKFPGIRPDPEAFIEALDPLQPRVYSISSSLKSQSGPRLAHGRCGALRDRQAHAPRRLLDLSRRPRRARRQDQGLCAEGAAFALPEDPAKPIIMIGPGTGIAPFRAFLHERRRSRRRPQLAVLRPSAPRLRFLL